MKTMKFNSYGNKYGDADDQPWDILSQGAGFGEAPQQAFLRLPRGAKIASVATLALLAVPCNPENGAKKRSLRFLRFLRSPGPFQSLRCGFNNG